MAEPLSQGIACRTTERNDPLLRTFAPHDNPTAVNVNVLGSKPTQFRNTQSTPIKQFEHGVVTGAKSGRIVGGCAGWVIEHCGELIVAKDPGKAPCSSWGAEADRWIVGNDPGAN